MITYAENPPQNSLELSRGFLRVQGGNSPAFARVILQMSAGEYVTREIISRVVLARMANPAIETMCDLDSIYYTLGEAEEDADFGNYRVPVIIYAHLR